MMKKLILVKDIKLKKMYTDEGAFSFVSDVDFEEVSKFPEGDFEIIEGEKLKIFISASIFKEVKGKVNKKEIARFMTEQLFVEVSIEDSHGNFVAFEVIPKDELKSRPDIIQHGSHYWRMLTEEEEEELQQMLEFL
jgi:hypothetical protein